ncbi:hypothetical protein [Sodalis sp. (in: enterobacteria)]|uniref:hypothetical protein n=1 Tax=Sodalis sp. (in: enterobacteria) TaxID=1898979 RepID=UPI003F685E16
MSIDAVIPTPTYKPGYYFGFNITLASRALWPPTTRRWWYWPSAPPRRIRRH